MTVAIAGVITTLINDEVEKALNEQSIQPIITSPEIVALQETHRRNQELESLGQNMYNNILQFRDMLANRHRKIPDDVLSRYEQFFGLQPIVPPQV